MYVVTYIKNFHHNLVNVAVIHSSVIPQEWQVAIVNLLLVKSHEINKNLGEIRAISQSKIPWIH